jgi:hypothetical protein
MRDVAGAGRRRERRNQKNEKRRLMRTRTRDVGDRNSREARGGGVVTPRVHTTLILHSTVTLSRPRAEA